MIPKTTAIESIFSFKSQGKPYNKDTTSEMLSKCKPPQRRASTILGNKKERTEPLMGSREGACHCQHTHTHALKVCAVHYM